MHQEKREHYPHDTPIRKGAPESKPRKEDIRQPDDLDHGQPWGLLRGEPTVPQGIGYYRGPIPKQPIIKKPGQTSIIGK